MKQIKLSLLLATMFFVFLAGRAQDATPINVYYKAVRLPHKSELYEASDRHRFMLQNRADSTIRLDDMKVLLPVVFLSDSGAHAEDEDFVRIPLEVQTSTGKYTPYIRLFSSACDRYVAYPQALGSYLFGLSRTSDTLTLAITDLKLYTPFLFNKRFSPGVRIGRLTMTYAGGTVRSIYGANGEYEQSIYEDSFCLSQDGEETLITFSCGTGRDENENVMVHQWQGYEIEWGSPSDAACEMKISVWL